MEKPEFIDSDLIDLRVYLKILKKWKLLIVGITLLALVTSGILSFFVLTPVYQSKTVIMVNQYQDPKSVQNREEQDDLQSVVNSLSRLPEVTIKTYVGQMKNEALLRNVIDTLKLDKTIYTPNTLASLIDIQVIPETNLIEVYVKNNNPKLAAEIANTLAEKFLEYVSNANNKQLNLSNDLLKKQLEEKNKELTEAVANLNKERNQSRNVDFIEQEVKNKNQNLTEYQNQLLKVEVEYEQILAGKEQAEKKLKGVPEKVKTTKFDPELNKTVQTEEINPLYAEIAKLVAQKNIETAEKEAQKASIPEKIMGLEEELKSLQAELNTKKDRNNQLQEKVEQIKQTRNILAEKLTQVDIIKSVNISQTNLQVVTPAFIAEKPISPKKMLNIAIAMVLGLLLSIGLAVGLEFMNNTINKQEDIEQHLGLPILGMIPLANLDDFKE